MKTSFTIRIAFFVFAFLFLLSTGCYRDSFGIYGNGNDVTQTRSLNSFTGVDLAIDADVVLHIDPVYHVELHGQQNILNVLTTGIHGSVLKLEFSHNVRSHTTITIDVYAPYYAYAGISGSGNIQNSTGWNCSSFESKISGSGNITISGLQTSAVETAISGSGAITLDGSCTSLSSTISGSGDLHAFGLTGNTGNVHVSGSGKNELNLTQSIDVHISGSGDVYYKNNPALNVSISGAGHLVHVL
jgi:hypothetical protein